MKISDFFIQCVFVCVCVCVCMGRLAITFPSSLIPKLGFFLPRFEVFYFSLSLGLWWNRTSLLDDEQPTPGLCWLGGATHTHTENKRPFFSVFSSTVLFFLTFSFVDIPKRRAHKHIQTFRFFFVANFPFWNPHTFYIERDLWLVEHFVYQHNMVNFGIYFCLVCGDSFILFHSILFIKLFLVRSFLLSTVKLRISFALLYAEKARANKKKKRRKHSHLTALGG